MIITVTPNPAIDRLIHVPKFFAGKLNRGAEVFSVSPGGKGINVSYLLQVLGEEVVASGFIGGDAGRYLEEDLRENGITTNFVYAAEETRTNYIVLDESSREQTQINAKGPWVSAEEIEELKSGLKRLLPEAKMLVIGGSLPKGVEPDFYFDLISIANEKNVRTVFNVREEVLHPGIEAKPFLVKPDVRATGRLYGKTLDSTEKRLEVAQKMISQGVEVVLVGFDSINHLVVTADQAWEAVAPEMVRVMSTVYAADAMVGGMVYGLATEQDLPQAIRWGMSACVATTMKVDERVSSREEVQKFLDQIRLKEVG